MPTYSLPNPSVTFLNDKGKVLLNDQYHSPEVIVPAGFESDGNSAPWFARMFFPRFGRDLAACIIHDYCYGGTLTRGQADKLLKKNMKRLGFKWWKYQVMYWSVRLGGRSHYQKRQVATGRMTVD